MFHLGSTKETSKLWNVYYFNFNFKLDFPANLKHRLKHSTVVQYSMSLSLLFLFQSCYLMSLGVINDTAFLKKKNTSSRQAWQIIKSEDIFVIFDIS